MVPGGVEFQRDVMPFLCGAVWISQGFMVKNHEDQGKSLKHYGGCGGLKNMVPLPDDALGILSFSRN